MDWIAGLAFHSGAAMNGRMFEQINIAILIGAALVALSAVTSLVSQRAGAPLLLVFLAIGLLAGEDGLLGISFDSAGAAYFIGSLALAIILFDSGFETPLKSYRVAAAPALTLATLGVVLTAGLVGLAARFLFGIGWVEAFLLGSIVASTDAAAVFFLLRVGGLRLRDRVKSTLEIESGANDPMAIFLTVLLVDLWVMQQAGTLELGPGLILAFVQQIGIGVIIGAIGGLAIALFMNSLRDLDPGLFPITGLAAALVVYAIAALIGGSGFLAAYVAGLVAGNRRLQYAQRLRRFQVGMTWLAQIGMFLTLGLLATPSQFGAVALGAIALAAFLIVIARPLAVWICLLPFRFKPREVIFIGWVGLRGAVSILLAVLPGLGGVENGEFFFNVVFVMVLASLLLQGWTVRAAANLLDIVLPSEPGVVDRVELELRGGAEVELVGYRIHPESAIAMGERAPRWARPTLVIRDEKTYSIHNAGPLRAHDQVYLFASPQQVRILDRIYAKPANAELAAPFADFMLKPDIDMREVCAQYGLPVEDIEADETLGDFVERMLNGPALVGDHHSFGGVDLVVAAINDAGEISQIGVNVEPEDQTFRGLATRVRAKVEQGVARLASRFAPRAKDG